MKQYIILIMLVSGIYHISPALADAVNPQIANCEEITDPDTQLQVELCSAHVGCKLTMGIHKACAKVKTFLNNLKNLTFGENKDNQIDSSDVFDASVPYVASNADFSQQSDAIKAKYNKQPKKQITTGELEDGTKFVYEGPVVKGQRHGTGVVITDKGSMFRGEFVKGMQKGKGEMFNDETHKVGDMVAVKLNGKGMEINANGTSYEGGYKDNQYDGKGTQTFRSGDRLDGEFKEGKANGKGTYAWKDGSIYVGEFVAGNFEGRGKAKFANGNQYEGEWKADKKHGRGTFTWKDGSRYEGDWQSDKKLNGIETAANGSKLEIANGAVVKTPQQIANEIESQYDQKINAAAEACSSGKESCDTKCAGLALLAVLSKSGDTEGHLQCTNECDSEKESCDRQVSVLQQEKKQAVANALNPRPTVTASAPVAVNSGGAGMATAGSTLPESVMKSSIEINIIDRLKNNEIRKVKVQVGAYYQTKASLESCGNSSGRSPDQYRKCELTAYKYEVRGIKPSYKLKNTNRPFTNKPIVVPECSFQPSSYYETATEDQSAENTCYVLMMQEIHESMEFQIKYLNGGSQFFEQYASTNMIPGTSTGDCKKDLTKVSAESQKIMQRRPAGAKLEASAQVSMYIKLNTLRVLEKSCKGKPEYEGAAEMRRLLGDVHASCALFKTDTSMCIPKVAW